MPRLNSSPSASKVCVLNILHRTAEWEVIQGITFIENKEILLYVLKNVFLGKHIAHIIYLIAPPKRYHLTEKKMLVFLFVNIVLKSNYHWTLNEHIKTIIMIGVFSMEYSGQQFKPLIFIASYWIHVNSLIYMLFMFSIFYIYEKHLSNISNGININLGIFLSESIVEAHFSLNCFFL